MAQKRKQDFDEPPAKRQKLSSDSKPATVSNSSASDATSQFYDVVIVGGGVAGGYALHEFYTLQQHQSSKSSTSSNASETSLNLSEARLCLVTDEGEYPYERPALTKGFLLKPGQVDLPMFNTCAFIKEPHQERWYTTEASLKYGIFVRTSTRAVSIDFDQKRVQMQKIPQKNDANVENVENEEIQSIRYNKLLLATGTRATRFADFKVVGADAKNIYYLRSYADAVKVRDEILTPILSGNGSNTSNAGSNGLVRIVMIGGGYIGMETIAAFTQVLSKIGSDSSQKRVELIVTFPERYFMQVSMFKTIDALGAFYTKLFENVKQNNLTIKFVNGGGSQHLVAKFDTQQSVATSVQLKDGTQLQGDYFIVGIGARIDAKLYQNEPKLQFDQRQGIPVNSFMETQVSDVYACGDIALFPCQATGRLERFEHVRHARASAMHAMQHMVGLGGRGDEAKEYSFLPQFYSRIFDKHWEFYGDSCNDLVDANGSVKTSSGSFDVTIIANNSVDGSDLNVQDTKQIIGIWSKKSGAEMESSGSKSSNNSSAAGVGSEYKVCGIFIETGQSDEKANEKRELMKQIVLAKESIKIFGPYHPLNKMEFGEEGKGENKIEEFLKYVKKSVVPGRIVERHVTKTSKL